MDTQKYMIVIICSTQTEVRFVEQNYWFNIRFDINRERDLIGNTCCLNPLVKQGQTGPDSQNFDFQNIKSVCTYQLKIV